MICRLVILAGLLSLLVGCKTTSSSVKWYNPGTWISGSEARANDRAEQARDTARQAALAAAQRTAHETQFALALADESRPVEVARESNEQTVALLDQSLGALTVEDLARLREQVRLLTSELAHERTRGEAQRAATRAENQRLSQALSVAETKLTQTQRNLRHAFTRENELANQLRNERWWSWFWRISIGTVALLAFAAWIYLRATLGGMPTALTRTLADLRAKSPDLAEKVTSALDVNLTRAEQRMIKLLVAKFTP